MAAVLKWPGGCRGQDPRGIVNYTGLEERTWIPFTPTTERSTRERERAGLDNRSLSLPTLEVTMQHHVVELQNQVGQTLSPRFAPAVGLMAGGVMLTLLECVSP